METTAGILRQLHDLGRSGALRRVLTRVTETFARQDDLPAPGIAARSRQWGDVFWEASPRAASLRASASVMKQHDLFGWLEGAERAAANADPANDGQVSASGRVLSRAERLAKLPASAGVRRVRTPGRPSMYSEQRRTVAGEAIARLLEVNRSVIGVQGVAAVKLPSSQFSAQVDLWKGRPVGTPFVMGN